MHNIIWANHKTQPFVYLWLHAHATFNITCFPAFFGTLDFFSSVLSIHYLLPSKLQVIWDDLHFRVNAKVSYPVYVGCSCRQKQQLLQGVKWTVEGLLATSTSDVWAMYGGLQRLCKHVDTILNHRLKVVVVSEILYLSFKQIAFCLIYL